MHERHLIRTAEAMCDDIDAKLSRAKPRPEEPTPAEWAQGFADGIGFSLVAVVVVFLMTAPISF